MYTLILLRHGESQWNLENRFTGWTDVDLTLKGISEAKNAGEVLSNSKLQLDCVYTSVLKRAKRTMKLCLDEMKIDEPKIFYDWRLNERHYGALQGLNKLETAKKFGKEQVHLWRRSYDISPPKLKSNDKRHPKFDKLYSSLESKTLPSSESLKDTILRLKPLWDEKIFPQILSGIKIMVVAHGNSIRGIIKILENLSDEEITNINIPTGSPLVYKFNENFDVLNSFFLS